MFVLLASDVILCCSDIFTKQRNSCAECSAVNISSFSVCSCVCSPSFLQKEKVLVQRITQNGAAGLPLLPKYLEDGVERGTHHYQLSVLQSLVHCKKKGK